MYDRSIEILIEGHNSTLWANKLVVLLVNHREQSCGVHQFGKRLFHHIMKSHNYKCYYIDVDNEQEFDYWRDQLNPQVVVYNYYNSSTMPWLTPGKIAAQRPRFKQASIFHEVNIDHMGFDLLFHQDPDYTEDHRYVSFSRPIPLYRPVRSPAVNDVPIIRSFGFGLGGKGFTRIIDVVQEQFSMADIELNIPFAAFGDSDGKGARDWENACKLRISNPLIRLKVIHVLMGENSLIYWLAGSTVNCFFYDENYGRGISGTLDYALAAGAPIAITKSWQFKHVWMRDMSFCIENNTLDEIINAAPRLDMLRDEWSEKALINDFEYGFHKMLGV